MHHTTARGICAIIAIALLVLVYARRRKTGNTEADMIEYGCMVMFVAVAAGAFTPDPVGGLFTAWHHVALSLAHAKNLQSLQSLR